MNVGTLLATLVLDSRKFTAGIKKATKELNKFDTGMKSRLIRVTKFATGIGIAATAVGLLADRMARGVIEMQSIDRRMKFATKTAYENERIWKMLEAQSVRLGLSLGVLAESYGKLRIATSYSNMSTEDMENLFMAISESARVMGLSAERTRLAFLAVEQMASKGVISMEELRRQLGDQLPGAVGLFASALRMALPEFIKLVATGKLASDEVLPLVADYIRKDLNPAVKELGENMASAMAKSETAWFKLKKAFSEGIFAKMLEGVFDFTTMSLSNLEFFLQLMGIAKDKLKEFDEKLFKDKTQSGTIFDVAKEKAKEFTDYLGFTEEEIENRLKKLKDIPVTEEDVLKWADEMAKGVGEIFNVFSNFIVDLATGADVSFKELLNNILKSLLQFTTQMLIVKPMMDWLQNWFATMGLGGAKGGLKGFLGMFGMPNYKAPAPPPSLVAMAGGGVIAEPVLGMGLKSGSSYLMGEKGPETVTPMGQGNNQPINVTINALDSKSVTDLMNSNPQAVLQPLVNAINSGDRGLSMSLRTAVS